MSKLMIKSEKWYKGKALKEIVVLPDNSLVDYASFIYFLPNEYRCNIIKSKINGFSHRINFYQANDLVFHLFNNNDFSNISFLLDKKGYELDWKEENDCLLLTFPHDGVFGQKKLSPNHPYVIIGKKFNKIHNYLNNKFLSLFIDENILSSIRKHDKYLQRNFIEYLRNNFPGSIIVYLTGLKSDQLIKLEDNQFLFGLSWVFPWAIFILCCYGFSCFMTDTTFKALKPYTLSILEIIVGNESLPIGISVSPSETANSYNRLWNHLLKLCYSFQESPNLNINFELFLKQKPFVCDMGTALKKFIIDNGLIVKYCHRHFVEMFGSSTFIGFHEFLRLQI